MDKIANLRQDIDIIDDQIMEMLNKRYELSTMIGTLKKALKTPVLDTNREQLIKNKISKYSHSPQIGVVYDTILSESKKIQRS